MAKAVKRSRLRRHTAGTMWALIKGWISPQNCFIEITNKTHRFRKLTGYAQGRFHSHFQSGWPGWEGLACVCACVLSCFSHVWLFETPLTVACQAPLSMEILQARIGEWVAMPSSRGSPQPSDWTQLSLIAGGFFSHKRSPRILKWVAYPISSRSSWPRNRTRIFCIACGFFTSWATREALLTAAKFNMVGI